MPGLFQNYAQFVCEPSGALPPARIIEGRVPQKSFLFLLEEKIGRAQNKKLRRKLFCGVASPAPERSSVRDKLRERRRGESAVSFKKGSRKGYNFTAIKNLAKDSEIFNGGTFWLKF